MQNWVNARPGGEAALLTSARMVVPPENAPLATCHSTHDSYTPEDTSSNVHPAGETGGTDVAQAAAQTGCAC